jgi:hypothetical protein
MLIPGPNPKFQVIPYPNPAPDPTLKKAENENDDFCVLKRAEAGLSKLFETS